ncbi:hypothetical protein CNR22_05410 [Sphingobacteriaceae bacterium]|nr:hypothetical protein CNR22_05410 [Sphingobacteriaceae bacterium]
MKNVSLHYNGKLKKVSIAVNKANEILSSTQFYEQIRAYKKFDNSPLSPEIISRLLQDSGHQIEVTVNWIVPIVKTKHNKISVSGWDFSSNLPAGVNNLIYETVNSMDCLYNILNNESVPSYNQGSLTAPWVIGAIAEVMVLK